MALSHTLLFDIHTHALQKSSLHDTNTCFSTLCVCVCSYWIWYTIKASIRYRHNIHTYVYFGAFVWICAKAIVMNSNHFSVFRFILFFFLYFLSPSLSLSLCFMLRKPSYGIYTNWQHDKCYRHLRLQSVLLQQPVKMNEPNIWLSQHYNFFVNFTTICRPKYKMDFKTKSYSAMTKLRWASWAYLLTLDDS